MAKKVKMKPRQIILTTDMGKPVVVNAIRFDSDGKIKFISNGEVVNPIKAKLAEQYDRVNKIPKVVFDIPTNKDNLFVDDISLLQRFDYIYAVDTNSKIIQDELITISCYMRFITKKRIGELFEPIVIRNKKVTEKMGWVELIRAILQDKAYQQDFKIAVVVDSDYGNINKYNNRELPLIGNLYLPPNFELIYASTDTGMNHLQNKLISECDLLAKRTYKKFE